MQGMWVVPEIDQLVEVYESAQGRKAARFPHSVPDYDMPEGLGPGDFALVAPGSVRIGTDGYGPINIDHQSATAYLGTDHDVADDGNYHIIEFDTVESDPEDLFDPSSHNFTVRHDGVYEVNATIEIPAPGQQNRFTLSVYRNGTLTKRKSRQSSVDEPLSLDVEYNKRLDAEDVIDIRLLQNSGSPKTVDGTQETSAFNIERKGI